MHVTVTGKQIDVGTALTKHVHEKLQKEVQKYFDNAVHADVVFSKEAHLLRSDINVNEGTGTGIVIRSQGSSTDIYSAFDDAVGKVAKQLRRYKRRIKDHSSRERAQAKMQALNDGLNGKKYIIANDGDDDIEDNNPIIIAEKPTQIERLTVSEAVMKMNLQSLPALVFLNKQHGGINIVYHRADGNISWIDTSPK